MKKQEMFRCTIIRGGTSKAIFLKSNELPNDPVLRDKVVMGIFGAPDIREIDGLGGSDITTSKLGIIGPPTRDDADIDYTFGQVSLVAPMVDYTSNCGNISAAVGPYAIDEGMVRVTEPYTTVRIHNTNTNKILIATVEVQDGQAVVEGDYVLNGVPGTGSRIDLDFSLTAGAATGKLLPTGNVVDELEVEGLGKIQASIVDIANSVVFVNASDLGIKGTESRPEIMANQPLCDKLEAIRTQAAIKCGFITPGQVAADISPLRPMISFVTSSTDYVDYASGNTIQQDATDFLARIIFNQMAVETYTGTGTICTAVAAMIEGSVVNQIVSERAKKTGVVRFGHPRGINSIEVQVTKEATGFTVRKATFVRTARRILDGYVYVKPSRLK